jgi:hypothetical protein
MEPSSSEAIGEVTMSSSQSSWGLPAPRGRCFCTGGFFWGVDVPLVFVLAARPLGEAGVSVRQKRSFRISASSRLAPRLLALLDVLLGDDEDCLSPDVGRDW